MDHRHNTSESCVSLVRRGFAELQQTTPVRVASHSIYSGWRDHALSLGYERPESDGEKTYFDEGRNTEYDVAASGFRCVEKILRCRNGWRRFRLKSAAALKVSEDIIVVDE